jgi:hypothetical protein
MQVLMTEIASATAQRAADTLTGAGHVVHACREPGMTGFACVALLGRPCPLEAHPIHVALAVRPYPISTPLVSEDGVRCAARRHVPIVVAGAVSPNPFAPWTTVQQPGFDVVDAARSAAEMPSPELSDHATAALRQGLERTGVAVQAARAEVRRCGDHVRVQVALTIDEPVSSQALHGIAVRMHQTMREIDCWSRGFDISVVTEQAAR